MSKQSVTKIVPKDKAKRTVEMPVLPLLRANRFELVDPAGKTRGGIGFSDQGYPILALTDDVAEKLTIRAELSITNEGPGLALNDPAGRRRLVLLARDTGVSSLSLRDEKGHIRFCAALEPDGKVQAVAFDSRGQRWDLVRQPGNKRPFKQKIKAIEAATNRDGKRGFIRGMGETFGVYDHAQLDGLWSESVKKVPTEKKAPAALKGGAR
jgi:hypothetical protein